MLDNYDKSMDLSYEQKSWASFVKMVKDRTEAANTELVAMYKKLNQPRLISTKQKKKVDNKMVEILRALSAISATQVLDASAKGTDVDAFLTNVNAKGLDPEQLPDIVKSRVRELKVKLKGGSAD